MPINMLNRQCDAPESRSCRHAGAVDNRSFDASYVGHKGVQLDLATGQVTWEDDAMSRLPPQVSAPGSPPLSSRFGSSSTSFGGGKLPDWL